MKKSTLITTIAMIVVVVVALSTATYAWFSSSTSAVATSATITTTAAGDWTIASAQLDGSNNFVVGQAADTITLHNEGLTQGLWSPVGKIATAFNDTSVGVSGKVTTNTTFIEARVKNSMNVYNATAVGTVPDVLKVSNAQQSPKSLQLSVVLNAGSDTTKVSSFYACAAVRFYVVFEVMDGETYKQYTVSNAYGYASTTGYSDTSLTESVERSGGTTYEKKAGQLTAGVNGNETVIANINYLQAATVTGESAQFKNPISGYSITEDNLVKYGVTKDDYIFMYNYTLPVQVAVGQSTNVLIYTWIDGWQAQTEAAGSSFTVNYAFNTASV